MTRGKLPPRELLPGNGVRVEAADGERAGGEKADGEAVDGAAEVAEEVEGLPVHGQTIASVCLAFLQ